MGRQYVRQSSASASAAFCSSPSEFAPARTRLQRVVVNTRGSASTFNSQSVTVFTSFYKLKKTPEDADTNFTNSHQMTPRVPSKRLEPYEICDNSCNSC